VIVVRASTDHARKQIMLGFIMAEEKKTCMRVFFWRDFFRRDFFKGNIHK